MLNWLKKDPTKRIQAEYEAKLKEARDAQRGGDIEGFAALTAEAEKIAERLDEARKGKS